jgi:type IV secretory pathway VirB2 component (pilin)
MRPLPLLLRGATALTALPLDDDARAAAGLPAAGRAERLVRGLLPLLPWAVGGATAMATGEASAQALFGSAAQRLCEAYRFGKGIIYAVAGIGVLILGAFAMLGRFDFGKFFAVAGGIFLAGSAEQLIGMLGGSAGGCGGGAGGGAGGVGIPAGGGP